MNKLEHDLYAPRERRDLERRWVDDAIRQPAKKAETPRESRRTDPAVQQDRAAFQRKLVATAIDRVNSRFGKNATHDKFTGDKK